MNKLLAASVLAVLGHTATASAGVPAWCKDATFRDDFQMSDLSDQYQPYHMVVALTKATCKPSPDAIKEKAKIEAVRQEWGKNLHMSEADWADAVAFANLDGHEADLDFSVKDLTAMTPLDQYLMLTTTRVIDNHFFEGWDYMADMFEPNLSEVGRLAFIERCVALTPSWVPAVEYAQCQGDIDAFDATKFAADLRGDTAHPAANRMAMRLRLLALQPKLKEHADAVKKIFAKDTAYKQAWDAAAKGRAQWAATIGQNKELLALAEKLDSATFFKSRKQFEGCAAATEAALAKIIAEKVPASAFKDAGKDIPAALDDRAANEDTTSVFSRVGPMLGDIPELMFIAGPYIECHDDKDSRYALLGSLFGYSTAYRGPRRAALAAISHEKIVLDDISEEIHYPGAAVPFATHGYVRSSGGVVKSVKVQGDDLLVTLEKLLVKRQECVQSHQTKKITRVNSDGSLSYELICDKMGTVTYDDTPSDFYIDKSFQPLLKKGVQFTAVGRAVLAIWKDKNAKLPNNVLGVPVK